MPEALSESEQILQRIGDLEKLLLSGHPQLGMELARIHKNVAEQPELLHILSDEQIALIVKSQSRVAQIDILQDKVSSKSASKPKKTVTLDDI